MCFYPNSIGYSESVSDGNPDSVTDIQSDSQSYCELDYYLDSDRFGHPVSDILGNTNRKPESFDQLDGIAFGYSECLANRVSDDGAYWCSHHHHHPFLANGYGGHPR